MSIYHLKTDFEKLQQLLEAAETQDELDAVHNTLAGMSGELKEIVEQSCMMLRNFELQQIAIAAEVERLSARSKAITGSCRAVRDGMKRVMELMEAKTVKTDLFTVTLAEGAESVDVFDINLLPDSLVTAKYEIKPDKKAIRQAIKDGADVPGAKLVVGEKSLRIK